MPIADADIQLVPVSGGPPRTIAGPRDAERLGPLVWLRDGRSLLFVRGPHDDGFVTGSPPNEIWQLDIDTGHHRKLDIALPAITRLEPHPDGRRLAISAGLAEFEVWALENLF